MVSKSSMLRTLWEILVVCPSPLWISRQESWIVTGLSSCWTTPTGTGAQTTRCSQQLPFIWHCWVSLSKRKRHAPTGLFGMRSSWELWYCLVSLGCIFFSKQGLEFHYAVWLSLPFSSSFYLIWILLFWNFKNVGLVLGIKIQINFSTALLLALLTFTPWCSGS